MHNVDNFISLISTIFGAFGTFISAKNTYGSEPFEGAVFGGPLIDAHNEKVKERNAKRTERQRWGLWMLFVSFVLQGIAIFV